MGTAIRLLLLFSILIACNSTTVASEKTIVNTQVLRFGVISLNHPLVMYRQYLPFTEFIAKEIEVEVELILARNYEDIVGYLTSGKIDIALLAGVSYLQAQAAADIVMLCAVLAADGTPSSRSVFLTREDRDDIVSLADTRKKRFAFGSAHSTSSYLQPLWYLFQNNIFPSEFKFWKNLSTQDAVIRAILRGNYDAGVVSQGTFKRFEKMGLKLLETTPPFPGFVVVSTTAVPKNLQIRVQELLLNLDYSSPETASSSVKWSNLLRHGFAAAEDSHYNPIRQVWQEMDLHGLYPGKKP